MEQSVAIGSSAGKDNQKEYSVAMGANAGQTTQGSAAVAIGYNAGQTTQSLAAVAIGYNAGKTSQGLNSIAIGTSAAQNGQGNNAVAIGIASNSTGNSATAIGASSSAGYENSTAIGHQASTTAVNTIQLGNTSVTDIKTSGAVNAKSFYLNATNAVTSASSTTIDLSLSNMFKVSLGASISSLNLSNAKIGTYVIQFIQGGTYSVSFPTTWKWSGSLVPIITTTAGKIDLITIVYDGSTYFASAVQNF